MHRLFTLIFALSLLFTVVLPIHALAGGVESNVHHIARMHNRMLKKRGSNPLAQLLGNPNSQASSGDGGAANVGSVPTAQPQSGNPSTSDNTGDGTSAASGSGQTNSNSGSTTDTGAGTANGGKPSTGGTNSGNTGTTTGSTGSNSNGDTNQSENSPADSAPQQGNDNPIGSIVSGILGSPKTSSSSSAATPTDTPAANNSSSTHSNSTTSSTSSSTSSSTTPTATPTNLSTNSPSSIVSNTPTGNPSSTAATSSTSPSQTAPPNDDTSSPGSTTIAKNTIIILVAIGASVGIAAVIWTIIRKWKFRPSSSFEGRMQPIDWQPPAHDDDVVADRLTRNASTRSHGSFTSGNGHNDNSLVADLPPLDAVGASGHLAPVGGYANLQRGPSPQPMFELPNPYQYPVSQPPSYNAGQGTAYGY